MQKIHWHDGLHLCPEHLQSQDSFVRGYIDDLINRLEPYLWGIVHIETHITPDKIMLNAVTARFADSIMVDCEYDNGNYKSQPPLEVDFHDATAPFSVYLGCPISGQRADRFLAIEVKSFPTDLEQDEQTLDIVPCLVPKLKLLISDHQANPDQTLESDNIKYSVIEIARFYKKQKSLEADESFIPPLLNLSADKWMHDSLQNIAEKTRKATDVQHQRVILLKKHPLDAADLTKAILMYSTLARYRSILDLLEQEIKQAHPKKAFAVMTQMHNELIAVEGGKLDDDIFLYCHEDLFKTFNKLVTALSNHLSRLDMNWVLTDLEKTGNIFKATIKGSVLRVMKRMALVGPTNCTVSHFFWDSEQQALQKTVIQKRQRSSAELSAYYRHIEDNDERPIIHGSQQLFLECNRDHDNWRKIKNNQTENVELWVYLESEPNCELGWQLGVLS